MDNPKHKGYEKKKDWDGRMLNDYSKPIDGERSSIWVKLTDREYRLLMDYLEAQRNKNKMIRSASGKKRLEQLEQRYLNEIAAGKDIDGVHARYVMCHSACQRVYRRSRPDEEDEPRKVETGEKYHLADGSEHAETVRVRRRKFVPLGLYCDFCHITTTDEEFRLLGIEERKAYTSSHGPFGEIKQGFDNDGYFQKRFNYATL